ncbi:MAG TPA: response regulator [Rhizomicrobium sp.]|jgi:CheY-like chemotaxis protein|nr:response regulator [Rhizomicrobium sp.]
MDRVEFSSHKILIVGGKTHSVQLLRSVLGIAGVTRLIQVEDSARAMELLATEHFSAVFASQDVAPVDGMTFAVAARRKDGILNPMIPIFALQERARRRDVEHARDAGVTDVLTTPLSPQTIMTKLRVAFHTPRAFIVATEFFGPDRRGAGRAAWFGADRRTRTARKGKVDFTQI